MLRIEVEMRVRSGTVAGMPPGHSGEAPDMCRLPWSATRSMAAMDLSGIPWRQTSHPGVRIHFYASDRQTGRTVALIAMEPGCGYPGHRHRGPEEVLVLQGGYRDERGEHREGDCLIYEDGSAHAPVALAGDTCVLFTVAHEGIELLTGGRP
jgi:putative transcriptional regulator